MNHSIKRFLLICITFAIVMIYGLISFASYLVSKDELDEVYDATLQQVANVVADQHLAINDIHHFYNNNKPRVDNGIEREEEFYVRVLAEDGTTLYVSHQKSQVPVPTGLGFSTQKHLNKKWRFFTTKANQETIQVAQPLKFREATIKETALSLMVSQLVFIPILGILLFMAIKKALAPLSKLSADIQQRDELDFTPFSEDGLPAEIKPLVHSLNTFMKKASDMVSTLKRFTSDAAHELRTPITALRIQLTLIEQAKTKTELKLAVNNLKRGIERSDQLIHQLLTLARTEPNSNTVKPDKIKMLHLIKECVEDLLPQANKKLIDLGLNTSEEFEVVGVHHEIKVLINNIMANAIHYTPCNGKVDIALFANHRNIILEIKDTGPGIPNDDLERVFERFYRGKNDNVTGSGLGLSIVKEIAIKHNADIEILNLNPGLSFNVFL